jgi:hypothetical protein
MFCHKCGVDLPDDSQFCRKCGQAQSVSVGGGAAVAPARIPEPAPKPQNLTLLTVLCALPLLFLVCWIVWGQHSTPNGGSTSQPFQPPLQQHKLSLPLGAFTVRQLSASSYKFTVPAGAFNVTMKGHFAATGGARNDVEVLVLTEDDFMNWQNRHPVNTLYSSGQVTQDSINLTLPSDPATYYVVFSNKFSFISPKAVEANIDFSFYTR